MTTGLPRHRSLTIATAGHVDHGKTLLVRNLTGVDTDTLAEEKSRGLSINLGFAYRQYEEDGADCLLGFVDVPGHIDFIGNMLAGVGAVDAAMLVIAADDGVMPQTEEHAAILNLLDISSGCVALTKIDRASKTRVTRVKSDIRELLAGSGLAEAPIFPVSNIEGDGIDRLSNFLHRALQTKYRRGEAPDQRLFRFLIDRSFSVRGIGTVVTGSCRSGSIESGNSLLHTRSGGETRIRGIRVHREDRAELRQGERAALNIVMDHNLAVRGDWLLEPRLNHPVTRFDAHLRLLQGAAEPRPNTRYHMHIGAGHHLVTLRRLGDSTWFQVKTRQPVHALYGDRFILRDPAASHTLGGGHVVDIFVPARGRDATARLELLTAMDQQPLAACRALTELLPDGLDLDQFSLSRNLGAETISDFVGKLQQAPSDCIALTMEGSEYPRLLGQEHFKLRREAILAAVAGYHRAHPDRQGVGESQLPRTTELRLPRLLLKALVELLLKNGNLQRTGSLLHIPGHGTRLGEQVEQFLDKARPILQKAGKVPPRTRELAEMTGIPLAALEKILRQSEISGVLVKVADNRHYLPETIRELAALVEQMTGGPDGGEGLTVIGFRDATGIGRNLCIEILEYFDGIGYTRRDGNIRYRNLLYGRELKR